MNEDEGRSRRPSTRASSADSQARARNLAPAVATAQKESSASGNESDALSDSADVEDEDVDESDDAKPTMKKQRVEKGATLARKSGSPRVRKKRSGIAPGSPHVMPGRPRATLKQPPWTPAERAAYMQLWTEGRREGAPAATILQQYQALCTQKKWPLRNEGAVRGMRKRERGGGDSNVKWTSAEEEFVKRLHGEGKQPSDIARRHAAEFALEGRTRSARAIREKLAALQQSVTEMEEEKTQAPGEEVERMVTSAVKLWIEEEDQLLRKYVTHARPDLLLIQRQLADITEADGVERIQRSIPAIQSRLNILKSKRELVYQRKRTLWTPADDELVRRAVIAGKSQRETVEDISARIEVQPTFVKRRWAWYRRRATADDMTEETTNIPDVGKDGTADEESDQEAEAAALRSKKPDAWREIGLYPSGTSDVEESQDALPDEDRPSTSEVVTRESAAEVDAAGMEETEARATQGSICLATGSVIDEEPVRTASVDSPQPNDTTGDAPGDSASSVTEENARSERIVEVMEDNEGKSDLPPTQSSASAGAITQKAEHNAVVTGERDESSTASYTIELEGLTKEPEDLTTEVTPPMDAIHVAAQEAKRPATVVEEKDESSTTGYPTELEDPTEVPDNFTSQTALSAEVIDLTTQEAEKAETVEDPERGTQVDDSESAEENLEHSPHLHTQGEARSGGGVEPEEVEESDSEEEAPRKGSSDTASSRQPAFTLVVDELVDQIKIPMTPRRAIDEAMSTVEYWKQMKKFRLKNKGTPIAPHRRDLVWASDMDSKSPLDQLRLEYVTRQATHDRAGTQFNSVTSSRHRPRVKPEDMRELAFGATLLLRGKDALLVWLKEMWVEIYQDCRDPNCCLLYDVFAPEFHHPGVCRHWEYWNKRQVHLDEFTSRHDYLLAQALEVHHDAFEETAKEAIQPATGWPYIKIEVRSYGMMNEMTKSWPAGTYTVAMDHIRPLFGLLSAILPTQSVTNKDRGLDQLKSWDYGRLYYEDHRDRSMVRLGRGFAVRLNYTWVLMSDVDPAVLKQHLHRLHWGPKGNIANYMRRFQAIEYLATVNLSPPLLDAIVTRQEMLVDRAPWEKSLATTTQAFVDVMVVADEDQCKVIQSALTQKGIVLARGPYGCGKTTLISMLVQAYCSAFPGHKIAIVSEANAAVDADQAKLIDTGVLAAKELVRLGTPTSQTPDAHRPFYLASILDKVRRAKPRDGGDLGAALDRAEKIALDQAQVVIGTLSQFGKQRNGHLRFDMVINDEAAQTLEASLLQVVREAVSTLVLIGDPQQLTAYSPIDERERDYFMDGERRHKLTWSLMHSITHSYQQLRGVTNFPGVTMTAQFRSHPKISRFLAPFYDYEMRDRARTSPDYLAKMELPGVTARAQWLKEVSSKVDRTRPTLGQERVFWLSPSRSVTGSQLNRKETSGNRKDPEAMNLLNYVEVAAVLNLSFRIRACLKAARAKAVLSGEVGPDEEVTPKTVLIISPYSHQVAAIQRHMNKYQTLWEPYFSYAVYTTDSCQGREAEITIVSMVRNVSLGFLEDQPARALVSLSRGRDYLFMLADHSTFQKDRAWRQLMVKAEADGLPCYCLDWTPHIASERLADESESLHLAGADAKDEEMESHGLE